MKAKRGTESHHSSEYKTAVEEEYRPTSACSYGAVQLSEYFTTSSPLSNNSWAIFFQLLRKYIQLTQLQKVNLDFCVALSYCNYLFNVLAANGKKVTGKILIRKKSNI